MTTQTYNGWTNWATWNVALWLGNDEGLYRSVLEPREKIDADSAERLVRQLMPRGTPDCSFHHYDDVDWDEIANAINEMRGL